MAITVDWSTQPWTIEFKQADLTLVEGTRYTITVDKMWELLRDFSDGPEGSARQKTFRRTAATASTPAITEINDPFYDAQFEDGAYSVDIINGNSNFRDVEVKNQVSVGTNNTTGFIDPTFLELGLFGGVVSIDQQNSTGNAISGTGRTASGEVIGTRQVPSNNIADTETIAQTRGLRDIQVMSNLSIVTQDLSEGYSFTGDSPFLTLSVGPAANVSNCAATLLTISGEFDGFNTIRDCLVGAITGASGFIENSAFSSTVSLSGQTSFFRTYSQVPGSGYPVITTGSNVLVVRDHHGSLGIAGMTGGTHSIGVYGGRLVIEASCTGGTIHVRGEPYEITDLSGGAVTLLNQTSGIKTDEQWTRLGLNPDDAITDVTGGIDSASGKIDINRTGDGITSSTLTRQ